MEAGGLQLGSTFGIAYVGAMVAIALYGITTLQSFLYFNYYPYDRWSLKIMVMIVWIAETVHVVLVNRFMYIYLIDNFGNPSAFLHGHWTIYMSVVCNLVIASVVQIYFATRVYMLGKNIILTSINAMLIVARAAFAIETVVRLFQLNFFSEFSTIEFNSFLPLILCAALPDILISASLCYYLRSNMAHVAGIRSTQNMINLLMKYAVNRALLTCAVAMGEMVLYIVNPNSLAFLAMDFCVGKIFANTLLGTLNARKHVRMAGADIEVSNLVQGRSDNNARTSEMNIFRISRTVDQTTGTVTEHSADTTANYGSSEHRLDTLIAPKFDRDEDTNSAVGTAVTCVTLAT